MKCKKLCISYTGTHILSTMCILVSNAFHLLLFASLMFFQIPCKAQDPLWLWTRCFYSQHYTSGSQYETNLNHFFTSLYTKAPISAAFNTTVAGENPDQVYGLVQCRGDILEDECRKCVNTSITLIRQKCFERKEAFIWFDHCVLRYSFRWFFSNLDVEVKQLIYRTDNVTSPYLYHRELPKLMNILANVAPTKTSKFAANVTNYSELDKIYGLVQCNRGLSNADCSECLSRMIRQIPYCCNGPDDHSGMVVASLSCYIQYDTVPFFKLPPPPPPLDPAPIHGLSSMQINIILGSSIVAVVTIFLILTFIYRKKCSLNNLTSLWKKKALNTQNIEIILKNYGSIAPQRYRYSAIKKMTDSFKDKLGQGGYGHVYKGRLVDGSLVAVKVLSESKGKGDDFINEVTTIGGTNHLNIVRLLGFCSDSSKRALVYEFMPNGSLEKFIFVDKTKRTHALTWEKLYQIALGIAQGLEYLHRGCNTRILHLDIKPHNVLLDENFCPKISDFGLAKLCPTRESAVSMLGARGTIGYIAPEIYYRNIGKVSYKSDVYSYGVMILEMVGGIKNIEAEVEHTSEIYFPHWIYDRIKQQEDIGLGVFEEVSDEETVRKMILVGLWCIQTDPTDRPSMNKVVEMLQGGIEGINMPSKSFLHSSSN